jgi:hypothetical protein
MASEKKSNGARVSVSMSEETAAKVAAIQAKAEKVTGFPAPSASAVVAKAVADYAAAQK